MKLSKPQIRQHEQAEKLLSKEELTYLEKCFVYENWYAAYSNQIGKIASFFTPFGLANDFTIELGGGYRIVDLCAGIGILSFIQYHKVKGWENKEIEVVCIEQNPQFVEVGKKLFPEAKWICGDVLDQSLIKSLGKFDYAISNPPYGNIKTGGGGKWLKYNGGEFELKTIEVGGYLANFGVYIIPPMSCPFEYSGSNGFKKRESEKYKKFYEQTGIELEPSCGIDTSVYKDDWKGTSIITEIVVCDYENFKAKTVTMEQQSLFNDTAA